jgi:prophage antirepressor-like protein
MNEMIIFNNPEFGNIRMVDEDGSVLFCGNDVAKALGYKSPKDAISTHCRGAVKRRLTDSIGREQDTAFIPESDLYRLVFSSKLPTAEKFTDWVTKDVLPAIRKHGGYVNGQNDMTPEELMAAALLMAQKTIADRDARISTLTVENQIMAPKADYFDALVDRNLLTGFRETAKQLGVPPRAFVNFLIEKKYVYRDKKGKILPYEAKNDGLFEVKECLNEKTKWSGVQTLITPKGRETFRLLFSGAA